MKTATLNIAKSLTVVTETNVSMANLSNFVEVASKFDVVNLNGIVSTAKFNKYVSVMTNSGYSVVSENWIRHNKIADGATDFSITFSK